MRWEDLLAIAGSEPVFSSALLLAGPVSAAQVRLQLSRWVKAGRLLQLRRGLYALAPSWRKTDPHPFLVANRLQRGSYVSMQSGLAWHGLIPEHVPVVTSVGPGRRETVTNALGTFQYNHMGDAMLFGYQLAEVSAGQSAFLASPEKSLLDLVYLTPGGDSAEFLKELRLRDPGNFDAGALMEMARGTGKGKLLRAARAVESLLSEEGGSP